jgi:hypothetical protein
VAAVEHRRGREEAHDVVTLVVAVGEREQAEETAAEHAVGEPADGGASCGRSPPRRAACTRRA